MLWSSVATVVVAAGVANAQAFTSPPSYPAPWMRGGNGWDDAYAKAKTFVSGLTLLEKVNLTTGVGWNGESCVGNTGSIPRLNFAGLCMQDSPLGVRFGKISFSEPKSQICMTYRLSSGFGLGIPIWHERSRNLEHSDDEDARQCNGLRAP